MQKRGGPRVKRRFLDTSRTNLVAVGDGKLVAQVFDLYETKVLKGKPDGNPIDLVQVRALEMHTYMSSAKRAKTGKNPPPVKCNITLIADIMTPQAQAVLKKKTSKPVALVYIFADMTDNSRFQSTAHSWFSSTKHIDAPRVLVGLRTGEKSEITLSDVTKTASDIKSIDCFVIDLPAVERNEKNLLKSLMHHHYVSLTTPAVVPYFSKLPHVYSECSKTLLVENLEAYYADTPVSTSDYSFIKPTIPMMADITADEATTVSFEHFYQNTSSSPKSTHSMSGLQFVRCYLHDFTASTLPLDLVSKLKRLVLCDNEISRIDFRPGTRETAADLRASNRETATAKTAASASSPRGKVRLALEELYLCANLLKSIPATFSEVAHTLRILDLRANRLTSPLAPVLWTMTELETLDLSCNNLTSIPPDVSRLWKLRRLLLFNNDLRYLPLEVGSLKHLQELHVEGNLLRRLPLTLPNLTTTLTNLNVSNNPIIEPPQSVIEEGQASIMAYLSENLVSGEPSYRLKLIFVGQPDTGKTSLLRAIKDAIGHPEAKTKLVISESVELTKSRSNLQLSGAKQHTGSVPGSTTTPAASGTGGGQGGSLGASSNPQLLETLAGSSFVDIDLLRIETEHKEQSIELQFSSFDFSAQSINWGTHTLFMSERSVFVVVWDFRKSADDNRLTYWLNLCKERAYKSPVVLIGTHADELTPRQLEKSSGDAKKIFDKWKKKRVNLKHLAVVSLNFSAASKARYKTSVRDLVTSLSQIALEQPYMGNKIPTSYFILEEQFQAFKNKGAEPKALDWATMQQLAAKSGVITQAEDESHRHTQEREILRAISFLQSVGGLYRYDIPGLAKTFILEPKWLFNLVELVVLAKRNYVKAGLLLTKDLFEQIWNTSYDTSQHQALIDLLELHGLCSRYTPPESTGSEEEKVLIPALLPSSKPGLAKMFSQSLATLLPGPASLPAAPTTGEESIAVGASAATLETEYIRIHRLYWLPTGFFPRFITRAIAFCSTFVVWKTGMLVTSKTKTDTALIEIDDNKSTITISVRGDQTFFKVLNELVGQLLRWFDIAVEASFAVCSQCLAERLRTMSHFTILSCEQSCSEGQWIMECPEHGHRVRIDQFAPDLALFELESKSVDMAEVELKNKIGEGGFATVYRALLHGETVAAKVLNITGKKPEELPAIYTEFKKEVFAMAGLKHPNLVELKAFSLKQPFALLMGLAPFGPLHRFLASKVANSDPVDWNYRLRVAWDIASAMSMLHTLTPPMIHRDLKSPNVLVVADNYADETVVKVADLGSVSRLYTEIRETSARNRLIANPLWLAPEIIRGEPYGTSSDVYPFGIIMWELVCPGRKPYDELQTTFSSEVEALIKEGTRPTVPESTFPEYAELMRRCWANDPSQRPTYKEIIESLLPPIIARYAPELHKWLHSSTGQQIATEQKQWRSSVNRASVLLRATRQAPPLPVSTATAEQPAQEEAKAKKKSGMKVTTAKPIPINSTASPPTSQWAVGSSPHEIANLASSPRDVTPTSPRDLPAPIAAPEPISCTPPTSDSPASFSPGDIMAAIVSSSSPLSTSPPGDFETFTFGPKAPRLAYGRARAPHAGTFDRTTLQWVSMKATPTAPAPASSTPSATPAADIPIFQRRRSSPLHTWNSFINPGSNSKSFEAPQQPEKLHVRASFKTRVQLGNFSPCGLVVLTTAPESLTASMGPSSLEIWCLLETGMLLVANENGEIRSLSKLSDPPMKGVQILQAPKYSGAFVALSKTIIAVAQADLASSSRPSSTNSAPSTSRPSSFDTNISTVATQRLSSATPLPVEKSGSIKILLTGKPKRVECWLTARAFSRQKTEAERRREKKDSRDKSLATTGATDLIVIPLRRAIIRKKKAVAQFTIDLSSMNLAAMSAQSSEDGGENPIDQSTHNPNEFILVDSTGTEYPFADLFDPKDKSVNWYELISTNISALSTPTNKTREKVKAMLASPASMQIRGSAVFSLATEATLAKSGNIVACAFAGGHSSLWAVLSSGLAAILSLDWSGSSPVAKLAKILPLPDAVPGSSSVATIVEQQSNIFVTFNNELYVFSPAGDLKCRSGKAHSGDITCLLPYGQGEIASFSDDGNVRIWAQPIEDPGELKLVRTAMLPSPVYSATSLKDKLILASESGIQLHDSQSLEQTFEFEQRHSQPVSSVLVHAESKTLWTTSVDAICGWLSEYEEQLRGFLQH